MAEGVAIYYYYYYYFLTNVWKPLILYRLIKDLSRSSLIHTEVGTSLLTSTPTKTRANSTLVYVTMCPSVCKGRPTTLAILPKLLLPQNCKGKQRGLIQIGNNYNCSRLKSNSNVYFLSTRCRFLSFNSIHATR